MNGTDTRGGGRTGITIFDLADLVTAIAVDEVAVVADFGAEEIDTAIAAGGGVRDADRVVHGDFNVVEAEAKPQAVVSAARGQESEAAKLISIRVP
jgi:hypothetical protein